MLRRLDRLVLVGGLLIAAQLGFRAWALWGSWFYFDDLAFMSRAMNQPFDAGYLFESYGGHLMPAGFALAWVMTKWWVYDWAPWAITLLLLQALASVGILRLLVSMFGRRPFVLVLLTAYLVWVFTLPAGLWWAAGINQLPLQVALGFGLTAFLAHLRTRRVRHLVVALVWVALGLLFYEKTVLVLGIYAVVALGWFTSGTTPQRLRGLWAQYRLAVVASAALGAAYLAVYARFGLDLGTGQTASVSWTSIAWDLVAVAMLPAAIGGPLTWEGLSAGSLADPSDLVMVASWAAVAGLAGYAWRSRTISLRAWTPVLLTTVANVVLLASARAGIVGPGIAREYRYQTEAAVVLVLGIGLAFLPLRGATEQNGRRADAPVGHEDRRLVAAITVVVVALALVSSVRYVHRWQSHNQTRAYLENVERALTSADQPVPLVDAGVPQTLLWSFRYPENTYSHLFRPWSADLDFPRNAVEDLYVFDDSGELAQVRLDPARSMKLPEDADADCPYPLEGATVTIPLDGPVIGGGWWIALNYHSPAETSFRLVAGDEAHDVTVPAGRHTAWFQAAGTFDEVRINSFPEDSELCVTGLVLGSPRPEESRR